MQTNALYYGDNLSIMRDFIPDELGNRSYPRIQIITIRELLDGRKPDIPLLVLPTYQPAERVEQESPGQERLFG